MRNFYYYGKKQVHLHGTSQFSLLTVGLDIIVCERFCYIEPVQFEIQYLPREIKQELWGLRKVVHLLFDVWNSVGHVYSVRCMSIVMC